MDLKFIDSLFGKFLLYRGLSAGPMAKPLVNVNITVKGKNIGTTTDAEGRFKLDVNANDVLVVSSVGFGSKEIKVTSPNENMVIALDISSSPLDEVQIIAYGTTSQKAEHWKYRNFKKRRYI